MEHPNEKDLNAFLWNIYDDYRLFYDEICKYETLTELIIHAEKVGDDDCKNKRNNWPAAYLMAQLEFVGGSMRIYKKWRHVTEQEAFNALRQILRLQKQGDILFGHAVGSWIEKNR